MGKTNKSGGENKLHGPRRKSKPIDYVAIPPRESKREVEASSSIIVSIIIATAIAAIAIVMLSSCTTIERDPNHIGLDGKYYRDISWPSANAGWWIDPYAQKHPRPVE